MYEVIKVADEGFEGGFKIINKSDFDPGTMVEFSEVADKPSTDTKDTKETKKVGK